MTENNPYAAPVAPVDATPLEAIAMAREEPPYFAVSTTKLIVMSIATFNLYSIYWFFRHWKQVKRTVPGLGDIRPFWRAFFAIFFTHDLFRRMRVDAINLGVEPQGDAENRATAYVVTLILGNILSRFTEGFGFLDLVLYLPLIPAVLQQREINAIVARSAPDSDRNASFTGWNIAGILFGGIAWLLIFIGMALPN